MISETKRRILAAACGLEWHEWPYCDIETPNRDFDSPEDWELVRVNVVVPHLNAFCAYAAHIVKSPIPYGDIVVAFEWWLTKSPEECCEIAADFILANLSLFPDEVQEKIKEIMGAGK